MKKTVVIFLVLVILFTGVTSASAKKDPRIWSIVIRWPWFSSVNPRELCYGDMYFECFIVAEDALITAPTLGQTSLDEMKTFCFSHHPCTVHAKVVVNSRVITVLNVVDYTKDKH